MDLFNIFDLMYWGLLFVVIWFEAVTFGDLWKRRESARWTMGYFTVFFLSIPLVVLRVWDVDTWLGLFFAVGVSGAAKVGWEQWRDSRLARRLRSQKGGWLDGWETPWKRG